MAHYIWKHNKYLIRGSKLKNNVFNVMNMLIKKSITSHCLRGDDKSRGIISENLQGKIRNTSHLLYGSPQT